MNREKSREDDINVNGKSLENLKITEADMDSVYKELKVPYKYGMVVTEIGDEENVEIDCQGVYRYENKWYMTFVSYNSHSEIGGYRTHLASSKDLLNWKYEGCVLDHSPACPQCAAFPGLQDVTWGGSCELEQFDGRYWWTTMEGSVRGYEGLPMNIGQLTARDPSCPDNWVHEERLILSVNDKDVRELEKDTLYKSNVIHDISKTTGHEFVMFYNAKEKNEKVWVERIFMAVSDDMIHWKRYGEDYVLYCDGSRITGDPQVVKIGDLWVMNLFVYPGDRPSYDTFAVSRDLVNWKLWEGGPVVCASESYDSKHAHKPWVIKYNGVVYHYYCARGENPTRGIALAASVDLRS